MMSPDICKCHGDSCLKKESCYRYVAPDSSYQSYFVGTPDKDGVCTYYWKTEERKLIHDYRRNNVD